MILDASAMVAAVTKKWLNRVEAFFGGRDEQRREQTARGHRIHHEGQKGDADDGEPALHERDQENAGEGDQNRNDRKLHRQYSAPLD